VKQAVGVQRMSCSSHLSITNSLAWLNLDTRTLLLLLLPLLLLLLPVWCLHTAAATVLVKIWAGSAEPALTHLHGVDGHTMIASMWVQSQLVNVLRELEKPCASPVHQQQPGLGHL
jgi:hypothetical protein